MKLFATKLRSFPDPRSIATDGVVDMSDDLSVERLLEAYSFGIFPWPHEELPTLWFSPPERGVLDFRDFHIPHSLEKFRRQNQARFSFTFNKDFEQVMDSCALLPRKDQSGTWITPKLKRAYLEFHGAGYAHSLEVWDGEKLAGGLYGVYVAGVFSGESMFFRQANASKLALVRLIDFLQSRGLEWMDIQMVTPLLGNFGGKYISRDDFLRRIEHAKMRARAIDFPQNIL